MDNSAYNLTTPCYIFDLKQDEQKRYTIVRCHDKDRKIKNEFLNRNPQLAANLTVAAITKELVQFKAFKPWNPDEWFIDMDIIKEEEQVNYYNMDNYEHSDLIKKATEWAMTKQYRIADAKVSIWIKDGLLHDEKGLSGYTHMTIGANKRHIVAVKVGRSVDDILTTLFHELRHVAQQERGFFDAVASTYKGEYVDKDKVGYWNLPWEIDARKAADILLERWKLYTE